MSTIEQDIAEIENAGGGKNDIKRYLDSKGVKYQLFEDDGDPNIAQSIMTGIFPGIKEELSRRKKLNPLSEVKGIAKGAKSIFENKPLMESLRKRYLNINPIEALSENVNAGMGILGAIPSMAQNMATSALTTATFPKESFSSTPITAVSDLYGGAAGGKALVMGARGLKASRAGSAIRGAIGDLASEQQALVAGVSKDAAKRMVSRTSNVLDKELRGTQAYQKVGEEVQTAVNLAGKEYAAGVAREKAALTNIKEPIINSDIAQEAGSLIGKSTYRTKGGELVGISKSEEKMINSFIDELNQPLTAEQMHILKKALDDVIDYAPGNNMMSPISGTANNILTNIRGSVNSKLRTISPGYAQANDKTRALLEARKMVESKIKGVNVGKGLKSALNDDGFKAALSDLSDALPPQYQFMDRVLDLDAAQQYQRLFRKGGGTLLGGLGAGALVQNPAIGAAVGLSTSPIVNRTVMGAGRNISDMGGVLSRLLSKTPTPF